MISGAGRGEVDHGPFRIPPTQEPLLTVHVVSHTHWDREWYHTAERFRHRLVALVDELLDEPAADGSAFLLDGQAVVLEDYLAVRPERAAELATALKDGRLEAGPWFVLADELIPGAEGLVRNLLSGRRALRALRVESPPVLYCPDSFGHPAALPAMARGFGLAMVVVWRGLGGAGTPTADTLFWIAPDGDRVLTHHLPPAGYELGANLPSDDAAARERWLRIRAQLVARSAVPVTLLLNGADHHARQRDRAAAVAALARAATPDRVESSSLAGFARALEDAAAGCKLPELRGELRDSYGFTWTLQGTLASRAPQKRRYARVERELVRDVEPWAAFARLRGGPSSRHLLTAAWHPVLLTQPHDTLCGCSIDAVARAMDARLDSAAAQAAGIREDATLAWIGHDRETARGAAGRWTPLVLLRNRAPRPRSGVAIVELASTIADVPVGPGSAHVAVASRVLPRTPRLARLGPVQVLERRIDHDRTESPRAYPDNAAVARLRAAVWVEAVPAYGVAAVPFASSRARNPRHLDRVRVENRVLGNGRLRVRFDEFGAVTLEHGERTVIDLLDWESRRDRGDLYTPAIREPALSPRLLNTRVIHRGPLRGSIEQRWRLRNADGRMDVRVRFVLDAQAECLRVQVAGTNAARDHRLRLRVRTDVIGGVTVADAAFGPVMRHRIPTDVDRRAETPVPTAPLHRYVSLFGAERGATVYSDGLTEYEVDGDTIAVTMLRSVGELSRSDIPERPGHAGWPVPTPQAQCLGPFEAELALLLHGPRTAAVVDEIERTADDVLLPLTGETLRSATTVPEPRHGVALEGTGLAFSCAKESENGDWLVLRCVNLLDADVAGSWVLSGAVEEAHLARLDETPLTPLRADGPRIPFLASPRGIVTILVRYPA